MRTPVFTVRRGLFTGAAIIIAQGNLFLWKIGHDPWYITAITLGLMAGALAWFWVMEIRNERREILKMSREPKQIMPWFNTDTLAMQVLATIENEERDRMERAGETSLPERAWADTQSVSLEEALPLSPSLEDLCILHEGTGLSDRADEAMQDELAQMAREVLRQMPQDEREALLEAARQKWDE